MYTIKKEKAIKTENNMGLPTEKAKIPFESENEAQ